MGRFVGRDMRGIKAQRAGLVFGVRVGVLWVASLLVMGCGATEHYVRGVERWVETARANLKRTPESFQAMTRGSGTRYGEAVGAGEPAREATVTGEGQRREIAIAVPIARSGKVSTTVTYIRGRKDIVGLTIRVRADSGRGTRAGPEDTVSDGLEVRQVLPSSGERDSVGVTSTLIAPMPPAVASWTMTTVLRGHRKFE